MALFNGPHSNYDRLFFNGCPQVLNYLLLKYIFKGLNFITSSPSFLKIPRCSDMGTCFIGCWQVRSSVYTTSDKYVARANWLSCWNSVNGKGPSLRLSNADFWVSFSHGTWILQKVHMPARFALLLLRVLLVLNLVGFCEGLCSGHADSTELRVKQHGFHISSLRMKSSNSMSTGLF